MYRRSHLTISFLLLVCLKVANCIIFDYIEYCPVNGVTLKDGDEFDYIVVGAGAAGSAAASRLALAGYNVLLVEAGGDPDPISEIPGLAMALLGTPMDWQYDTISNNESCLSSIDKQCRASRGKCLGGSTSINYMMYVRGNRRDFDDWDIDTWRSEDVQPFFLRYEGLQVLNELPPSSIPYHNTTGNMKLEFFSDSGIPWHPRIPEAFQSLKFPFNPDVNAESQIGVTQIVGYTYEGARMGTARGYLYRCEVNRKLKVAKWTRCTGVIIDDGNVARGITVTHGLLKIHLSVYAKREIILSAGTLATPQLLMLSGIGPADHLKTFNISVRADLPVGNEMTDHVLAFIFVKVDNNSNVLTELAQDTAQAFTSLAELLLFMGGPLTSDGLVDITAFANTLCYDSNKRELDNNNSDCEIPSTQFIFSYVNRGLLTIGGPFLQNSLKFNNDIINQLSKISADYGIILIGNTILRPKSVGTLRLASTNPHSEPAIFFNYLSNESDIEEMLRSITMIEHLMETDVFKTQNVSIAVLELEDCPEYSKNRTAYWECYVRYLTISGFHTVSTTPINQVVDLKLRVLGIEGLRVADAGVLPKLPRGNIAAATIAIGERVAEFILNDSS